MIPESGTDVSILANVPFDNSYAHIRWFTTSDEQTNYFKSFAQYSYTSHNFQKIAGRYFIDVDKNVHQLFNCNYLMFKNNDYSGKWFYGFVTNMVSLNVKNTRLYFELDVIQTWRFNLNFKKSFILREHETRTRNYNVIPESINVGNEYETIKQYELRPQKFYYLVYGMKERIDLDYDEAMEDGNFFTSPDSLHYYVIPIPYPDSVASLVISLGEGSDTFTFSKDTVSKVMNNFRKNTKVVNNIVSCYLTEYLPITVDTLNVSQFRIHDVGRAIIDATSGLTILRLLDRPDYNAVQTLYVGNVFSDIDESEPKLRLYPYTVIEVSDGRGNVLNYKPEGLKYSDGDMALKVLGAISFSNYVAYGMESYNKQGYLTSGELLSNALINSNPQDLTVLDDRSTAYVQGAKNSMEAQKTTWNTDMVYQKTSNTIRGVSSASNLAVNAGISGMNASGGKHMAQMGGGLSATGVIDDTANIVQSGVNSHKAGQDYQNKVNEQNAMLEDISNLPPNLVKQGSNVNSSMGNNLFGVRVRIKRVKPEYLDIARNYFKVFGVKSNKFKLPNLTTRTRFNYIQTSMINIQASVYNEDIRRIKEIFDNGTTLWHTNDMYNYDVENEVR